MAGIQLKKYPPYMGSDPYIFLSFSTKDTAEVLPLLKRLSKRHVRYYYVHAAGKDVAEAALIQKRIQNASFMVFLATEHSVEDEAQKGFGQHFESLYKAQQADASIPDEKKKKFLVVHLGTRNAKILDYGFSSGPVELAVTSDKTGEKLESTVLHADGFTQDFIGEKHVPPYKKMFLILGISALLLAAGLFAFIQVRKTQQEKLQATLVPVTDRVISEAAETAVKRLGFKNLNKSNADYVETLELDTVPESPDDLSLFKNLKRLVVPQNIAAEILELSDGQYDIVLEKGEN